MKLNITLLFATAVLAMLLSCKKEIHTESQPIEAASAKKYANLEKANWLLGGWGNKSVEGELSENWNKENDSVFHGKSYFVVGGKDTVFAEHIRLEDVNNKLTYIVTVPGQNNDKPVRFETTTIDDNQIVFENPQHDYPNKIVYNKIGNDSLVAEIFGIQKGKPASEKFAMKKQ